jgi:hypothetical protein
MKSEKDAALKEYNKTLKRVGYTPSKKSRKSRKLYTPEKQFITENISYPSLSTSFVATPKSNDSFKQNISANYVIGQSYNKGNFQVLSKKEQIDPTTAKRR